MVTVCTIHRLLRRVRFDMIKNLSWISVAVLLCLIRVSSGLAHLDAYDELESIEGQLKHDPERTDLLHKRVTLLRSLGRLDEALCAVDVLLELHPFDSDLYLERALILKTLARFNGAESALTKALQFEPTQGSAYFERALIRERMKWYSLALLDYREGSLFKQPEAFHLSHARLLEDLQDHRGAREVLAGYLKEIPHAVVARRALVQLELRQKQYEEAQRLLFPLLAKSSFKTPWLLLQAEVSRAMGKREETSRLLQEAYRECRLRIEKRQASELHRTCLAEVFMAMGSPQAAERELTKVLSVSPDYQRARTLKRKIEKSEEAWLIRTGPARP